MQPNQDIYQYVESLVSIVQDGKGEVRLKALEILRDFSLQTNNQVTFASQNLDQFQSLVNVVRDDEGEARVMAMGILWNLSSNDCNKVILAQPNLGLIPLSVDIVRNKKDETRICALGLLRGLSINSDNQVILASPELGLVELLVDVVREEKEMERVLALGALRGLSGNFDNKVLLASRELGLVPLLVEVVSEDVGEARIMALRTLLNMAVNSDNQILFTSPELGMVPLLVKVMREDCGEARFKAVGLLGNMAFSNAGSVFIKHDVHMELLSLIQVAGPERSSWTDDMKDLIPCCLRVLMNIASHDDSSNVLKAAGTLVIVHPIFMVETNGCEGLKALLILVFLVGRVETTKKEASFLTTRPEAFTMLLDVYKSILDLKPGSDYVYGEFDLITIVKACSALCVSDSNKNVLANGPLLGLLVRTLWLFVEERGELIGENGGTGGGGGNDVKSAEYAIEALLQLSFVIEDNATLQLDFMSPSTGVLVLMEKLRNVDKLGHEARRNAVMLSSRLRPNPEGVVAPSQENTLIDAAGIDDGVHADGGSIGSVPLCGGTKDIRRRHIMLSYCWSTSAKPELVKRMSEALRKAGYDVWRDEEGSEIVGPMSGSTDQRMAEAIEAASVVVIFVSKQYKERPNCRMEAKYASMRCKKGLLKIVYVMLQEDYTTVSEPDCCDGWLGIMIGDDLWYPLWDESKVEATCRGIVQLLQALVGSDARLGEGIENSKTVVLTTEHKSSNVESSALQSSPLMSIGSHACSDIPVLSHVSSSVTMGEMWELPSGNAVSGSGASAVAHLRKQQFRCHCQCDTAVTGCYDVENRLEIMQRLYNRENEILRLQIQLETQRQLREMEMKVREVEGKLSSNARDVELNMRERMSRARVCWSLLKTAVRAIDEVQLQSVLDELGLADASDLCYCSEEELRRLGKLLKPVPRAKFTAMILNRDPSVDLNSLA